MKIKENIKAPKILLPSTGESKFELDKIKGKVLVYFYPKDDTPGCTFESIEFSKMFKQFRKIKCKLVGISKDDLKTHKKFKKKYKIPFELLSDVDLKVHKKYKVWGQKTFMGRKFLGTIRSTVFIDRGKIIKFWYNVRVKNHASNVFEFIKSYIEVRNT